MNIWFLKVVAHSPCTDADHLEPTSIPCLEPPIWLKRSYSVSRLLPNTINPYNEGSMGKKSCQRTRSSLRSSPLNLFTQSAIVCAIKTPPRLRDISFTGLGCPNARRKAVDKIAKETRVVLGRMASLSGSFRIIMRSIFGGRWECSLVTFNRNMPFLRSCGQGFKCAKHRDCF